MRPRQDIEETIKKFDVDINPTKDRIILDELQDTQAKSKHPKPGISGIEIGRIIMNSKLTKFSAAVVIIIVLSVGIIHWLPDGEGMSGIEITAEIPAGPNQIKVDKPAETPKTIQAETPATIQAEAPVRKQADTLFDYSVFNNGVYDESSLPQFYEILRDGNSPGLELRRAVLSIGLISKRGNKQAVKELLDYYKRSVNWDEFLDNDRKIDQHVFSKWDALGWIGFIGVNDGNEVEEILKKAMTVEGAKELAKDWYVDANMPPTTYSTLDNLRGRTALGLAYSEKPEVQQLIKAEYEKERKACLAAGKTYGGYINVLIDAMARMDIVKDIGLEGHRKLSTDPSECSYKYQVYIRKYMLSEAGPPVKKQI